MNKTTLFHIQNKNGFTLIEVLISITILSFIMLGVISFTDSSQTTAHRVITEDREMLQLETAMSRLEWDFSQIYSPLYFSQAMNPENMSDEEGEVYNQLASVYEINSRFAFLSYESLPVPIFQKPDKSTLIFLTSSNRRKLKNTKQSHFAWVKYSLLDEASIPNRDETIDDELKPKEPTSVLVRNVLTDNIYDAKEIDWDDVKTQVLFRKVLKLTFEFWNNKTQKWAESLDIIKDGNHLIRGLKVTIKYLDPSNVEKTTIRVLRPLFPNYVPEDMYKYLKPQKKKTDENGETTSE
jgi:prepilin-type N-terminal cleavage/methylation domain-containing protein